MRILLDNNNFVKGYAVAGGIEGSIDFLGDIPEGFLEDCASYKLENNVLIYDPSIKPSAPIAVNPIDQLRADVDYIALMSDIDLEA